MLDDSPCPEATIRLIPYTRYVVDTNRTYADETILHLSWRDQPITLQDYTFVRCTFRGCYIQTLDDPARRAVIRNVKLTQCEIWGESSDISGAIVEDCEVHGLKTGGLLRIDGCAFRHVKLSGNIGRIMITDSPVDVFIAEALKHRFVEANARYYDDSDWAIDISEAMPTELDLNGIPGRLIRRDPETQVLVRRERVLDGEWKHLPLREMVRMWLSDIVQKGWEDGVFVVPARGRLRRELMESMLVLRRAGIAEPD
jgi:hypothetical protein